MGFDVYDVSVYEDDSAEDLMDHDDRVEMGLSSGELRQGLLDRFRQELNEHEIYFINVNLRAHGLEVTREDLEDDEQIRSVLVDIENILYDMEDEEIEGSTWEFSNARIIVREDT